MKKLSRKLVDKLRAGPWLVATLLMATVIGFLYPHQLGVLLWSLTKLSAGAYTGYWIDRSIFYYARPGDFEIQDYPVTTATAMLRRAIIMAAAIVAVGLGV
ncbi:MAG: putative holin [Marinobacter sp.]|nr:putative holin [Marinobacter sp.]